MPKKFWDEARIAILRRLIDGRCSYLDVANVLGCSRSAVAGICTRLGIKSQQPSLPTTKKAAKPLRKRPQAIADQLLGRPMPKPEYCEGPDAAPPSYAGLPISPAPDPDPGPQPGLLLEELREMDCRWPLNDGGPYRFCGCRKEAFGRPYCAAHSAKAGGGQPKQPFKAKKRSGIAARAAVGRY